MKNNKPSNPPKIVPKPLPPKPAPTPHIRITSNPIKMK